METLEETLVVKVAKKKEGEFWHFNNWIIPIDQIVAVKQTKQA